MLSGTIDTCKWLFMKKAAHSMTARHFLENPHHHLVVVRCNVCSLINRSKLMLRRSNLVMLCFCRNTKFPALLVYLFHIGGNSLTNRSKIVIVHLLSLWRHCSKKCPACICKVFSLQPFIFIDQEVFLLCTNRRRYFF